MAERRMFTKKITDDDNFLSLSSSAQALYLHLSMSADDDGFNNQVAVSMFKAHASVQDLQSLLERRYIYQFDNGVIVIKHWRMANALRKDRYTATAFKEEFAKLEIKNNGAYTLLDEPIQIEVAELECCEEKEESARVKAYKESELPYSFDYKIKERFYGKPCPICGIKMQKHIDEIGIESSAHIPSIQHNIPISKGGKHELGNISVICKECNISIQDSVTGELNSKEVVDVWDEINGCRLVATGKDSIDKDSIDIIPETKPKKAYSRFVKPTIEEIQSYMNERNDGLDAQKFYDYYEARGWELRKGFKMKDWRACVRTWEGNNYGNKTKPTKDYGIDF